MYFGADPGGNRAFGVASLSRDGRTTSACVSCADEALDWITAQGEQPLGLGIDCPLWWSSLGSGDRHADQWLRHRYRSLRISSTVMTTNSLQGSVLVQGVMFAWRVRERYGDVPITEAHPKMLIRALGLQDWQQISDRFSLRPDEPSGIHQRDAVLAAIAAREGFSGRWINDLSRDRDKREQDPERTWFGPVNYFWPES
jgi:hypothetical protein